MDDESSTTPIITTSCYHTYHRGCLARWVLHSPTCPTCRGVLVPRPSEALTLHEAVPTTDNPWHSMSLYERITNFMLLAVMADTYTTKSEDLHPAYFLS
jgi:hypothetical protein